MNDADVVIAGGGIGGLTLAPHIASNWGVLCGAGNGQSHASLGRWAQYSTQCRPANSSL